MLWRWAKLALFEPRTGDFQHDMWLLFIRFSFQIVMLLAIYGTLLFFILLQVGIQKLLG